MHRTIFIFVSIALTLVASHGRADESRPNVLFIAVDDLRPELRCYGAEQIHSPNIDQLAESGRCLSTPIASRRFAIRLARA